VQIRLVRFASGWLTADDGCATTILSFFCLLLTCTSY
jgi:hypothetical protein